MQSNNNHTTTTHVEYMQQALGGAQDRVRSPGRHSGASQDGEFAEWLVGDEYQVQQVVGQGSYGSVAMALHKATNRQVAIKRLEDIFADIEDCKKMVRELLLLKALNDCPFVTKILDIIEPPKPSDFRDLYFVMEYVDTDLKKVIKSPLQLSELHV